MVGFTHVEVVVADVAELACSIALSATAPSAWVFPASFAFSSYDTSPRVVSSDTESCYRVSRCALGW
jgi:hypothetical protein